jgi:hypothetical protein
MSPISATSVIAVSRPTPGSAVSAWTLGSGLASAAISRSSRAIGVARVSSSHSSPPRPRAAPVAAAAPAAKLAQDRSTGLGLRRCRGRPAPRAPDSSARSTAAPGWPGDAAGAEIPGRLGRDPGLGQQIRPQQLRQGGRIDLVVLQPGRGDRLAAAGMDQMGLQLQLLQQLHQPPHPSAAANATGVPGGNTPRIGTSLAGSLARLRLRCWSPASSTMATCERLRCTSMPTYPVIRASLPELDQSRSLGCRAEQGTGPDQHSVRSIATVRGKVRRSDAGPSE